jgi:hypothetical protein
MRPVLMKNNPLVFNAFLQHIPCTAGFTLIAGIAYGINVFKYCLYFHEYLFPKELTFTFRNADCYPATTVPIILHLI